MSVQRTCEDCSSLSRISPCAECVERRTRLALLQQPGAWNERTDHDNNDYEA